MSNWIKCKDSCPKDGEKVIFELWRDGEVQAGRYSREIGQFILEVGINDFDFTMGYQLRDVRRWQPLLEAPNED